MKVTAFITDCCGKLCKEKDVVGMSTQIDLVDKFESFKTIPNANKADVHYCVQCYTKYVTDVVAQITDRTKNEADYIYYMKVHAHSFKMMVFNKFKGKK
jgi:hypothetical protein